jgi:hypothetical protein
LRCSGHCFDFISSGRGHEPSVSSSQLPNCRQRGR